MENWGSCRLQPGTAEKLCGELHWKLGKCIDDTGNCYHPSMLLHAQTSLALQWRWTGGSMQHSEASMLAHTHHKETACMCCKQPGECAVFHKHTRTHACVHAQAPTRMHVEVCLAELCHAACKSPRKKHSFRSQNRAHTVACRDDAQSSTQRIHLCSHRASEHAISDVCELVEGHVPNDVLACTRVAA